jgi:hypothetical protein
MVLAQVLELVEVLERIVVDGVVEEIVVWAHAAMLPRPRAP